MVLRAMGGRLTVSNPPQLFPLTELRRVVGRRGNVLLRVSAPQVFHELLNRHYSLILRAISLNEGRSEY